jgi:hypothetical protein
VTPLASIELLHRLTQVGTAYTIARMRVIEARSGEPIGVRRYGEAAALLCRQVPSPHFNSIVGLRGGQEGLLAEIDDWYRENKVRPRVMVAPGDLTAEMGRTLAQRGFTVTDTDTVLYGEAPAPAVRKHDLKRYAGTPEAVQDAIDEPRSGHRRGPLPDRVAPCLR